MGVFAPSHFAVDELVELMRRLLSYVARANPQSRDFQRAVLAHPDASKLAAPVVHVRWNI